MLNEQRLLALRRAAQAFIQAADEVLGEIKTAPKKHLRKKEKVSDRFKRMYEKNEMI